MVRWERLGWETSLGGTKGPQEGVVRYRRGGGSAGVVSRSECLLAE